VNSQPNILVALTTATEPLILIE